MPGLLVDGGRCRHASPEQCLDGVGTDGLVRIVTELVRVMMLSTMALPSVAGAGLLLLQAASDSSAANANKIFFILSIIILCCLFGIQPFLPLFKEKTFSIFS